MTRAYFIPTPGVERATTAISVHFIQRGCSAELLPHAEPALQALCKGGSLLREARLQWSRATHDNVVLRRTFVARRKAASVLSRAGAGGGHAGTSFLSHLSPAMSVLPNSASNGVVNT